ncbi:hypothetical protein ACFPM3_12845 [Streptomyces coeruleoprunus]|uniref:Transcriptional regulator n=1 Tax=Streptomyces coeruleoprunus TaxID=285563 RepID=A0ABV9XFS5_9ACTN
MSPRYQVQLHRIGRWWALDVPELTLHTQCRTLDEADGLARGLIADALGVEGEAIDLELVVPELASVLDSVAGARQRRDAAVADEQEAIASAVRALVGDLHLSQGDACRLLDLAPEEVAGFTPPRGRAGTGMRQRGPLAPAAPGPGTSGSSPSARTGPGAPAPAGRRRHAAPAARPSWAVQGDG